MCYVEGGEGRGGEGRGGEGRGGEGRGGEGRGGEGRGGEGRGGEGRGGEGRGGEGTNYLQVTSPAISSHVPSLQYVDVQVPIPKITCNQLFCNWDFWGNTSHH